MKAIRAGMGLGDALYLQGVVRHFVERGERLEVCCKWPDVFREYGDKVRVVPFRRDRIQILAHYSMRRGRTDTNQWQDCCVQAGIKEPWELRLDWKPRSGLGEGRPYICVALPRAPMDRKDGIGMSLLPDFRAIQGCIDRLRDKYRIVQIGAGKPLHQFHGIDVDLGNQTTVAGLLDVASQAHGFLGYCSFIVPLAESFSRPGLFVWSQKGLKDRTPFVRQITPRKILSKATSHWVMDDATQDELNAKCALL